MAQIEYSFLTLCTVIITYVWCADIPGDYYNARYDALDIDDVLNHKRLVHHYAACLLNRGPCPPQGKDLKGILPEALETQCARCTQKQKYVALNLIKRLKNEYPRLWKELQDAYDPSGELIKRFEATFDNGSSDNRPDVNEIPDGNGVGLFNRFGDGDDSENNVAGTLKPLTSPSPIITMVTKIMGTSPPNRNNVVPSETNIRDVATQTPSSTQGFRPVMLFDVDSGIRILGQISQIGNRVIRAGTRVADMFLSTVHSIIGN